MLLLALGLLAGCSDDAQDSGIVDAALPAVWGLPVAEDVDPDPDVVEVHLTAGFTTVQWTGDQEWTDVWAYNGSVPGPLIQAMQGQQVRVVFDNQLEDETTIHWHGLRIDDEMDGVPMIQDPVQPGGSFTYAFTPPDSGSFWYHPHVRSNEQVERGLQGAMVIHEPDAPTPARDRYFVLDDAYLRNGGAFYNFTMDHMEQMHGRFGNTLLANGQAVTGDIGQPLTDTVRPQAPERWRIVNTANARTMYVDVEGASWRVIAVDGALLAEPYTVSKALLPVGRRLDLEVIPDADAATVELQIKLPGDTGNAYPVFQGTVEGEAGDGAWLSWPAADKPAIPQTAAQEVEVVLDGYAASSGDIVWTVNGQPYGDGEAIVAQGNTPTFIRIREDAGFEHPFHLHGQYFQVVSVDGEPADETQAGLMDTWLMEGLDEVVLYTELDNPGRWMAHCHILEHAELGMMTELVVE